MNEARLDTIEQIREFLAGTADVVFSTTEDQATRHRFVATVLRRHRYFKLCKGHRGVLFAYMQRLTGYTRQHLTKLVGRYRQAQHLHPLTRASRTRSGPANLNSVISGNSGLNVGPQAAWPQGVFDDQEVSTS